MSSKNTNQKGRRRKWEADGRWNTEKESEETRKNERKSKWFVKLGSKGQEPNENIDLKQGYVESETKAKLATSNKKTKGQRTRNRPKQKNSLPYMDKTKMNSEGGVQHEEKNSGKSINPSLNKRIKYNSGSRSDESFKTAEKNSACATAKSDVSSLSSFASSQTSSYETSSESSSKNSRKTKRDGRDLSSSSDDSTKKAKLNEESEESNSSDNKKNDLYKLERSFASAWSSARTRNVISKLKEDEKRKRMEIRKKKDYAKYQEEIMQAMEESKKAKCNRRPASSSNNSSELRGRKKEIRKRKPIDYAGFSDSSEKKSEGACISESSLKRKPTDTNKKNPRRSPRLIIQNNDNGLPRPMKNFGMTCYMNTFLQCLAATPTLRDHFTQEFYNNLVYGSSLRKTILAINESEENTAFEPRSIQMAMRNIDSNYSTHNQQDCPEALQSLLGKLSDEESGDPRVADSLSALHTVATRVSDCCNSCDYESARVLQYGIFSLPLVKLAAPRKFQFDTLHASLEKFISPVQIEDYRCEGCMSKCHVTRTENIVTVPRVLILQLEKFEWMGTSRQKKNGNLNFRGNINVAPFMVTSAVNEASYTYELKAFATHVGSSNSGHYYAYVRVDTMGWVCCNDHQVFPIDPDVVYSAEPYLMFYERVF